MQQVQDAEIAIRVGIVNRGAGTLKIRPHCLKRWGKGQILNLTEDLCNNVPHVPHAYDVHRH